MAGGLKPDIDVGDVVVGTKVYAIHGGKQTPTGFLVRPEAWRASYRLEQAARAALRGRTGVHFKPIASGDVVLADEASDLAAHLRAHYNDAVALDLEDAGISLAGHLSGGMDVLTIRGISDTADAGKAAAEAGGSQQLAAENAAAAAMDVLAVVAAGQRAAGPKTPAADQGTLASALVAGLAWDRPDGRVSETEHTVLRALAKKAAGTYDGRLDMAAVVDTATAATASLSAESVMGVLHSLINRNCLKQSPSGRLEVTSVGLQSIARGRTGR
ncbi:hypothetical protein GCM10020295_42280 [Streptomyces cinereospinus]